MQGKGLGRWPAPDERDGTHLLRELTGTPGLASLPEYKYWYSPNVLDQNGYPYCVGFSAKTMLLNGPVQRKGTHPTPIEIYDWAQRNDEWPGEGEAYDGTSVRAGMKACVHFTDVTEYRWAFTVDDAIRWLLTSGPLVVGTDWYEGQSRPDELGWITPTGALEGGHAYGIVGASRTERKVRVLNNWGLSYGDRGRAWMSFDALEYLIGQNGEAACAVERRP